MVERMRSWYSKKSDQQFDLVYNVIFYIYLSPSTPCSKIFIESSYIFFSSRGTTPNQFLWKRWSVISLITWLRTPITGVPRKGVRADYGGEKALVQPYFAQQSLKCALPLLLELLASVIWKTMPQYWGQGTFRASCHFLSWLNRCSYSPASFFK